MTYYLTKTVTWFGERDIGEKNKINNLFITVRALIKIQNSKSTTIFGHIFGEMFSINMYRFI